MAPTGQPPPAAAAAGSVLASEAELAAERRRVLDGLASGCRMRGLSGMPKAEVAARLARLGRITVAELKRVAASCGQERGGSKQARRREAWHGPPPPAVMRAQLNEFLRRGGDAALSCSQCGSRLLLIEELRPRNGPTVVFVTCGRAPSQVAERCSRFEGMPLLAAWDAMRDATIPRLSLEATALRCCGDPADVLELRAELRHSAVLRGALLAPLPAAAATPSAVAAAARVVGARDGLCGGPVRVHLLPGAAAAPSGTALPSALPAAAPPSALAPSQPAAAVASASPAVATPSAVAAPSFARAVAAADAAAVRVPGGLPRLLEGWLGRRPVLLLL